MDAVKLKMDQLVQDKIGLVQQAKTSEQEVQSLNEKCNSLENDTRVTEKSISAAEEALDKTLTNFIDAQEKLETAEATASTAELEVNALTRKIKLIQEEQVRVEERYWGGLFSSAFPKSPKNSKKTQSSLIKSQKKPKKPQEPPKAQKSLGLFVWK